MPEAGPEGGLLIGVDHGVPGLRGVRIGVSIAAAQDRADREHRARSPDRSSSSRSGSSGRSSRPASSEPAGPPRDRRPAWSRPSRVGRRTTATPRRSAMPTRPGCSKPPGVPVAGALPHAATNATTATAPSRPSHPRGRLGWPENETGIPVIGSRPAYWPTSVASTAGGLATTERRVFDAIVAGTDGDPEHQRWIRAISRPIPDDLTPSDLELSER